MVHESKYKIPHDRISTLHIKQVQQTIIFRQSKKQEK